MSKKILVLLEVILWLTSGGVTGVAYGETDDSSLPTAAGSNGESGIDLSGFPARVTVDARGGTAALPGGPSIDFPPGALDAPTEIALRPTCRPPSLNGTGYEGYTVLTGWFDIATNRILGVDSKKDILLSIPVKLPAIAKSHPGLQILVYASETLIPLNGAYPPKTGKLLPLSGSYNRHTGKFEVGLIGLPINFTFAVAFNPNIREVRGYVDPVDPNDTGGFSREVFDACKGKMWGDSCDLGREGTWMCRYHTAYLVCDRVDDDTDGE